MGREACTETARELLDRRDWRALSALVSDLQPPEAVDLLRSLPGVESTAIFRLLPGGLASDVFAELEAEEEERLSYSARGCRRSGPKPTATAASASDTPGETGSVGSAGEVGDGSMRGSSLRWADTTITSSARSATITAMKR